MSIPSDISTRAKRGEFYARATYEDIDGLIFYMDRPLGREAVETLRVILASLKAAQGLVESRLAEHMKETV